MDSMKFDLEGWNEIAAHLNKDKRTVQRWALESSLPVHRVNNRLFAYKRELERWVAERASPNQDDRPVDFQKVFGTDQLMHLVYSELTLSQSVPRIIEAYDALIKKYRVGRNAVGTRKLREMLKTRPMVSYEPKETSAELFHFRAEHSACICEVRGAAYIAAEFSQYQSLSWRVVGSADSHVYGIKDLSFVSFGTLINPKSRELLSDPGCFVDFRDGRFAAKHVKKAPNGPPKFLHPPVREGSSYDYGMIVRIHPAGGTVKAQRAWIACAGIRQRGTSGAAWVLANWREWVHKLEENTGSFAALIRVPSDSDKSDDSAELLWLVERPEDLTQYEL